MNSTIDHESPVPLYYQLKNILQEKIMTGEWVHGDKIPSEHELKAKYNVSRNTIKKALDDMQQEELLVRKQGRGTFVAKQKLKQDLTGFYSFSKVVKKQGMVPKDIIISIKEEKADMNIAEALNIEVDEPVHALERLRCADDEPIILETSYIPRKVLPELSYDTLKEYSLYDYLEEKRNIVATSAKEAFEPVLIRDYESHYLEVKIGYPALLLDRITYSANKYPVEFCRSIVRGDRCRYYTELM